MDNQYNLVEGTDYEFLFPEEDKTATYIKLLNGPFEGVTYKYGFVTVKEENDVGILEFMFDIISIPDNHTGESLKSNINFKNHLGNILVSLMLQNNITSESEQEIVDEN